MRGVSGNELDGIDDGESGQQRCTQRAESGSTAHGAQLISLCSYSLLWFWFFFFVFSLHIYIDSLERKTTKRYDIKPQQLEIA